MKSASFYIQVNEIGGKHFRKYTPDTLQAIFDVSPSAANFEIMVLIEGIVFLIYHTHFIVTGSEESYLSYIKGRPTLNDCIKKINDFGIIDEEVTTLLFKYKDHRNEIAHDMFKLKSGKLEGHSPTKSLKDTFDAGLDVLNNIMDLIIPSKDPEYVKRLSGHYRKKQK